MARNARASHTPRHATTGSTDGATITRAQFLRGLAGATALAASGALLPACRSRETDAVRGIREGRLHRNIGPDLAALDPALGSGLGDYHVLSALFEGLVAEDPVDLHPVPGVAESWDVSQDGLTYTFHLRADARWHNGSPVTAGDFVAAWRRAVTPSLAAENAGLLGALANATAIQRGEAPPASLGARAVDDRTLVVTLARPEPAFLSMATLPAYYPVPATHLAKLGDPASRATDWSTPERHIGNGPFRLTAWLHGQYIEVARADTYWDAPVVQLHGIRFHLIDSVDAEERAYRAGQLHITDALPISRLDAWRKEPATPLRIDPLLGTYFYRINTQRGALADVRVRSALGLAVDRKALVEQVLRGGQAPAGGFVPPGTAGYTPPPGFTTDPAAARALLAEAGFPGGAGLPPIELLYNTSENHRLVAEALQAMWRRDLGIDARLRNMENTSVLAARRTSDYDLVRSSWIGDYLDPSAFLGIFTTGHPNNETGWTDPDYDALLAAATRAPDTAARQRLYQQAEALLIAAAPIVPLYHYTHAYLCHPAVKGWSPTLLDHHPYKHVQLVA